MKLLSRSTPTASKKPPMPKVASQNAMHTSRRKRLVLVSIALIALILFFASQFVNNEFHANERYRRRDAEYEPSTLPEEQIAAPPPPPLGNSRDDRPLKQNANPYAGATLATIDRDVANREHIDNVAAADAGQQQQLGDLKVDIVAEMNKNEADVRMAMEGSVGRGLKCPPIDLEAFDKELQIPLRHLPRRKKTSVGQKYDRRAHNCAGDGIWNRVTIKDHHDILQNVVRLARIRHGAFVFDWGSGCGHQLNFLTKEYGVTGVGVDVSTKTVAFAVANTSKSNLHCVADGSKLEWIPSGHFDNAYSFGSIYHVYNRSKFCSILRQMVRIVKPGGTVYNGWTENAEFRRNHVGLCLADLPIKFTIFEEAIEFKSIKIFPLKGGQTSPNTYSLVITKLKDYDPLIYDRLDLYSYEHLPLVCGVHQCEPKPNVVVFGGGGSRVEAGPAVSPNHVAHATAQSLGEASAATWSFEGWPTCPAYDSRMEEELQIPLEHLPRKRKTSVGQKYDRRAHNCATSGVWHKVSIADHKAILNIIGQTIEAKKGEIVFDWGCGCGHQLEFMHERFGTRGLGIDVSNLTIAYASNSTVQANKFCVADGTRLEWIPTGFFDKAYSFGSIYHVYDKRKFCSVLRQMVRIVKPGGIVYNGWTDNAEFHRDDVVKCVNTAGDDWMSAKDRARKHDHLSQTSTLSDADPDKLESSSFSPSEAILNTNAPVGADFATQISSRKGAEPPGVVVSEVTYPSEGESVSATTQGLVINEVRPAVGHQLKIEGAFPDEDLSSPSGIVFHGESALTRRRLLAAGDGTADDHVVTILPEQDLFSSVEVFPLKSKKRTRSTYSAQIRKSMRLEELSGPSDRQK